MAKMGKNSKSMLKKLKKGSRALGRRLTGKARKTKPVEFDNPHLGNHRRLEQKKCIDILRPFLILCLAFS